MGLISYILWHLACTSVAHPAKSEAFSVALPKWDLNSKHFKCKDISALMVLHLGSDLLLTYNSLTCLRLSLANAVLVFEMAAKWDSNKFPQIPKFTTPIPVLSLSDCHRSLVTVLSCCLLYSSISCLFLIVNSPTFPVFIAAPLSLIITLETGDRVDKWAILFSYCVSVDASQLWLQWRDTRRSETN